MSDSPLPDMRKTARYQRRLRRMADDDPVHAARALLEEKRRFDRDASKMAALWPVFLNTILELRIAAVLTDAEFTALERTAEAVAAATVPRVLDAHLVLGERKHQPALLAELWQGPPDTLANVWRVTRELARRRAEGTKALPIRVAALADVGFLGAVPDVSEALAACLAVDSRSGDERIRRGAELARYLRDLGIHLPLCDRALGFAALLADADHAAAESHLNGAYLAGERDREVVAALMSVLIGNGRAARAARLAFSAPIAPGDIADLAELSAVLSWLDDLTAKDRPPATSARIRELATTDATREWARYATGRLCLVEGDARMAAEILAPLAQAHPDRPGWRYHAMSALVLAGNYQGARECWELAGDGVWSAGCLLMDLDPRFAGTVLQRAPVPPAYAEAFAARVALSAWARPPAPAPAAWHPGGGTVSEDMESFRACLARWLAENDWQTLAGALALPVFARLPRAERMLWAGIAALPLGVGIGRALLQRAVAHGHPRAPLVLAVLAIAEDGAADGGLAALAGDDAMPRSPVSELLCAWAEDRALRHQAARERLVALDVAGDPRARYMLAAHLLRDAGLAANSGRVDDARRYARYARDQFRELTGSASSRFDGEARVALRVAELLGGEPAMTGAGAAVPRTEVPGWPSPGGSAWSRALAAIAQLADGTAMPGYAVASLLTRAIASSPDPPESVLRAAAALVTRACLAACAAGDADSAAESADRLMEILSGLTWRLPEDPVARALHGQAMAARLRAEVAAPSRGLAAVETARFPEVCLALAEQAVNAGDTAAAADVLRRARPAQDLRARLCRQLADVLEGYLPVSTGLASAMPGAAVKLAAPGAAVASDPLGRGKALLALLRDQDTAALVDVRANLPALCAALGASRDQRVPEGLASAIRELADRPGGAFPPVVAARCATAARDPATGHALWVRALKEGRGTESASLREESAKALRHLAVLARRHGDDQRAIWILRVAGEAGLARTLELQLAVARLVRVLFPWTADQPGDRPGRYRVLEEAVGESDALASALAAGNSGQVQSAWGRCLRDRSDDLRFLHAVAVLFRESALADPAAPEAHSALTNATALWSLLLAADEFWSRFPGFDGADDVIGRVLGRMLAAHAALGAHALDHGDLEAATEHFGTLAACSVGHDPLARLLGERTGIRWRWPAGTGAGKVRALADEQLAAWGALVARNARAMLDDTSGLSLPAGISRNYQGAAEVLESFAGLGTRARREVALAGLQTCNDWCFAYAQEPGGEGYRTVTRVLEMAGRYADQLKRVTPRGRGDHAENQAISAYYQLGGWAADRKDKCRYFTEAVEWNPSNAFAMGRKREYCGGDPDGKQGA